jgi:hypothetical protein
LNDDWIKDSNGGATNDDIVAVNPTDTDCTVGGNLLQLDDNGAGTYRLIDLSTVLSATLSFNYDTMEI